MKKCDKCRRPSIETTRESEELCIKHYNPSGHHTWEDNEEGEKLEPKKEVSINDYILL